MCSLEKPNLRKIDLKVTYRSANSDILNDFFIPCLQNSILYKRAVGYFTSASLSEAARGLADFVKNGGVMQLVASPRLTKDDVEMINKGYSLRDTVERALIRDLNIQLTDAEEARVKNLTWMIANRKLDIRIAKPVDPFNGDIGIYHEKIGIFYDDNTEEKSNVVAFSGSMNETANGLLTNYESIDVSISWDPSERERLRVRGHIIHFDNLWNGKAAGLETLEFPEAVKRQLIKKYTPTLIDHEPNAKRTLRKYQVQAIGNWEKANFKGTLSMATGSGKTLVALRALEKCPKGTLSIIVLPSIDLAKQWNAEILKEYPYACLTRCAYSDEPNWSNKIENLLNSFLMNSLNDKKLFIVTTLQTSSKTKFISLIEKINASKKAIVIDEVHHSGAPEYRKIFQIDCKYRIGLSATPERSWDDEGNQAIFDYFGPQVFEYSMADAIRDGVLTQYNYFIVPVELTFEEKERFQELNRQIAVTIGTARTKYPNLKSRSIPEIMEFLDRYNKELSVRLRSLYLNRIGLIKRAENKKVALKDILKNHSLKRCLIYCNDLEHLDLCRQAIFVEGYEALEFSSRIQSEERDAVKESFAKETNGNKFLVAVKCLDEGVDLPVCDSAILISCSRSSREFVQRRGRVLRKHQSKKLSNIYDILVLPYTSENQAYTLGRSEYEFIMAELRRAEEFAKNALNKESIHIEELRALFSSHVEAN
jgi:superfamily II DNA or RNA helicase